MLLPDFVQRDGSRMRVLPSVPLKSGKEMKATVKYWKSLCKYKWPSIKSYQTLVSNIRDLLVPAKLQFFAFLASIFKPCLIAFQTDCLMSPFMYEDLSHILDQLIRLVFKREAIVKADTPFLKNGEDMVAKFR